MLNKKVAKKIVIFEKKYYNKIMEKIIKLLKKIDMSDNEIKIYLAILRHPKSNISKISKISGIKRTTVYAYLEKLLEKWFITKTIKWKIILYLAENPENILKNFEEKKRALINAMPLLKDIYENLKTDTKVKIFEGKREIEKFYEKMANSTTNIYTFFSPEKYFKIFSKEDSDNFNSTTQKNKIKLYDLVEDNEIWREYLKYIPHQGKLLPKDFSEVWMDLVIFEDYVWMISFDSMSWILIKDRTIHNLMKSMYKFIWKSI